MAFNVVIARSLAQRDDAAIYACLLNVNGHVGFGELSLRVAASRLSRYDKGRDGPMGMGRPQNARHDSAKCGQVSTNSVAKYKAPFALSYFENTA